ncbi:hypothetical protein [Streptomyces sp. NPDC090022]|uniref:hypothetical protein n=1 Tax=Streptomyces sp. NPDC090022 TaxID=3365920 RepID=UPI00382018BE
MIWAARTELPTEALARCIREVPGGGGAMNMEEISRYRASLPCEVVEIPEAEVKRRTASLAKEQARQEYARRNGLITRPDPRDAELAVMFPPRRPSSWLPDGLDETERLDRQQRHDARHAQWVREFDAWRQQHHTQDVREGYGDAVPDYEEA